MFWELYSRTYYFHSLPPGRMDKWFCLESCMGFSGFHVKDRYSTYRSCRSRVQAVLKFRPDGMVCLGVIRGKSDSQRLHWTIGVSCYQLLVSSKSSESPGVSQVALVIKNPPANAGDVRDAGSIPGLGIPPGEGNGHPLQYSCLENPIDRGAWGVWSIGLPRVGHNWSDLAHTHSESPEHLWGKCSCTVHKPFLRKEKKDSQVHWTGTSPLSGVSVGGGQGSLPLQLGVLLTLKPRQLFLRSHTLHLQSVFRSLIPPPFRAAKWQLTVVHSEMCSENNGMMKGWEQLRREGKGETQEKKHHWSWAFVNRERIRMCLCAEGQRNFNNK